MKQILSPDWKRLSPVQLAFWGSLLLSWIAVLGEVTMSRDGALYMSIAQTFMDEGLGAALQQFNWPWFAVLIGATSWVTTIPLETCGYLWCALLLAGTCALLVDCIRRQAPATAWWSVLVVLALPAYNTFRSDVIREYGFWFFSVLALWLALSWQSRGGWRRAAGIQLAVLAAALFRLEAVLLSAALSLWMLPGLRTPKGWMRLLQLNALPLLGLLAASLFLLANNGFSHGRVDNFLKLLDPRGIDAAFQKLAGQFAQSLKAKYSRDEAGQIIFFGMLAVILLKFFKMFGPFLLAFLARRGWEGLADYRQKFAPFAWTWLVYLAVLMVFFTQRQFINSRYVSFLDLLAVPFIALGVYAVAQSFPRLGKLILALALLVMLDNVIALGARKTHYIEAGHWLAAHVESAEGVYAQDPRMIYYAGWRYPKKTPSLKKALSAEAVAHYRYFLIEANEEDAWLQDWLKQQQKRILARFANRGGDTVLIVGD